MFMQFITS